MNKTKLPIAMIAAAWLMTGGGSAQAEEPTLKQSAKELGREVGGAARKVGQEAKKAGKAIGRTAKKGALAVKEGGKEFGRAVKEAASDGGDGK